MFQNAPAPLQAGERYLDGKGKRKLGETSISVDDLKGVYLPAKIPASYNASEKDKEVTHLREEISRLRNDNAALLEKGNKARGLSEEIDRLRNDNAALTGGMAKATRRVEVKKEVTEATVDRLQKANKAELQESTARLESVTDALENMIECIVCRERFDNKTRKSVVLEPCQHTGFCMECAKKVPECPLCRRNIKKRVGIVISQLPDALQLQLLAGEGVRVGGGDGEFIELSDDDE